MYAVFIGPVKQYHCLLNSFFTYIYAIIIEVLHNTNVFKLTWSRLTEPIKCNLNSLDVSWILA